MTATYSMNKRKTRFLLKCRDVHGEMYNYEKVDFLNSYTKVEIICHKHGSFLQTPKIHVSGSGCPLCAKERNKTSSETFFKRCNDIHANKYTYKYNQSTINQRCTIDITCPKHGVFRQLAGKHISGHGCKQCFMESRKLTRNEFVERANHTHLNEYSYDKTEYVNIHTKVIVTCETHGDFLTSPLMHLRRTGCPKCKVSVGHRHIRKWLEERDITFDEEHRFDDCRNVRALPFDFYIPSEKIAIEYDGIHHYEPTSFGGSAEAAEANFKSVIKNDEIKTRFCATAGIRLIRIPYYEDIDSILCDRLA